jgi:hypothetical protein
MKYRLNVNSNAGASYWCVEELKFYDAQNIKLDTIPNYGYAESIYSIQFDASHAFNEDSENDDSWYCSQNENPTGWLAYDFQTPTEVIFYKEHISIITSACIFDSLKSHFQIYVFYIMF